MKQHIAHVRDHDVSQLLEDHLLAAGKISSDLAAKIGMPHTGELLGLLHDIGKYSSTFQNYLKSATGLIDSDADGFVDAEGLKGISLIL